MPTASTIKRYLIATVNNQRVFYGFYFVWLWVEEVDVEFAGLKGLK